MRLFHFGKKEGKDSGGRKKREKRGRKKKAEARIYTPREELQGKPLSQNRRFEALTNSRIGHF